MRKLLFILTIFLSTHLFAVTVSLDKQEYFTGDDIKVTLTDGMLANESSWVGIYKKSEQTSWENAYSWSYGKNRGDGTYTLELVDTLPDEYEARVFFNDDISTLIAKKSFVVKKKSYNITITTEAEYNSNTPITVTLSGMPGNEGDWIGIFEKGKPSVWENCLTWKWDGNVKDGNHVLDGVPKGIYEARVFLDNSYTILAKKEFTVVDAVYNTKITTSKPTFYAGDPIRVTLSGMPGNDGDWIGLFEKDKPSIWENVLAWKWDGNVKNGTYDLDSLPAGEYEARVFLNNSYTLLAKTGFKVIDRPIVTTVKSDKNNYINGEEIKITFKNMLGNQKDWIGIFPVGSESKFENAYDWDWTYAEKDDEIIFHGLPAGEYEARAFFNSGFDAKASYRFKVTKVKLPDTILEDAESGLNPKWKQIIGNYPPKRTTQSFNNSKGTLVLNPEWEKVNGEWENGAEYQLPLDYSIHNILEMDIGGLANYQLESIKKGYMPHFSIGVYAKTKKGWRAIIWDSYFNHINAEAHIADYGNGDIWLNNPSPVEHVRGWYKPVDYVAHFKVNIEATLKNLEPDNELIYLESLYLTGGFLDNIKLSTE